MQTEARTMWALFERVHAVTYFAPQARAAYEAVGLRGYWRGYFAGRAAPLGAVGPGPVYAAFFGFHRSMVERALPDVWRRADPATVLRARLDGARAALAAVLGETADDAVAEAAGLLREAATNVEVAGRTLAAANADLPWPDEPLGVLWQAATVLREHRGDGHVAALLVNGLGGAESIAWRAAVDSDRAVLQPSRGWSDDEWEAATKQLIERGWLAADGTATATAVTARNEIERVTDGLAHGPWQVLGSVRTAQLARLLHPVAAAAASYLPHPNPIGLPRLTPA